MRVYCRCVFDKKEHFGDKWYTKYFYHIECRDENGQLITPKVYNIHSYGWVVKDQSPHQDYYIKHRYGMHFGIQWRKVFTHTDLDKELVVEVNETEFNV